MNELYQQIADAVVSMKAQEVQRLAKRVLEEGYPADEAIEQGLAKGMNRVGELFAAKEYFVPEVLVCSKAMYAGFDILKDHLIEGKVGGKGKIIIGVVKGDFHDIGKNIVKLMLEAAGFQLIDLGKNVPADAFLASAKNQKPEIAALSTLMTTTMDNMASVVEELLKSCPDVRIMVGGAPVSADFARSINAHFYGEDARSAVLGAHQLLNLPLEK